MSETVVRVSAHRAWRGFLRHFLPEPSNRWSAALCGFKPQEMRAGGWPPTWSDGWHSANGAVRDCEGCAAAIREAATNGTPMRIEDS